MSTLTGFSYLEYAEMRGESQESEQETPSEDWIKKAVCQRASKEALLSVQHIPQALHVLNKCRMMLFLLSISALTAPPLG